MPTRVLLVDDVENLRFLHRFLLRREGGGEFEVVGEAENGQQAIELARTLQPDLVLLDVSMPVMDGLEALPLIRAELPRGARIVMLSGFEADRLEKTARERGADAYLEKGLSPKDLVRSLRRILQGDATTARPPPQAPHRPEVSERIAQLESQLRHLTEVNEHLQSFAYTVSHDLRAPLRGIEYLTRALDEDAGGTLGPHRDTLRRIQSESRRMARLIEDLLTYARVSRTELDVRWVDATQLAGDVVAALAADEPSRVVRVEIEPELRLFADPPLLRVALENLISNAWKFTRKTKHARIRVARGAEPNSLVVEDNGAGFDASKADRLFQPFQRLHAPSDFEGTGVGLASVRQIAERHGGRVRAEGRPNEGARFLLALGAAEGAGQTRAPVYGESV